MKKTLGLAFVLSLLLIPATAFAADTYADSVSHKLQNGLTNTLLGWTKLVSVPLDYQQQKKNPWAGVGKGLVDGLMSTVGGAFNLVTFPIPGEMSIPDGGVNLAG